MIRNYIIRKLFRVNRNFVTARNSSSQINIQKLESEQEVTAVTEDEEIQQKHEELERKRNKSRLKDADYKMLHEQNPYPEAEFWHHGTLKYLRRTYGRYGAASGVDPTICWPVKEELEEALEYEKVKYPYTISQSIQEAKAKREEKQMNKLQRQQDIVKKIKKLEQWKLDLHAKIEKKGNEAMEAKVRKERLIEEVRRHFGYTVDPRDERFKELVEKKEKEQKKAMKEARKKARDEKMVKQLLKKDVKEEAVEKSETAEQNETNKNPPKE